MISEQAYGLKSTGVKAFGVQIFSEKRVDSICVLILCLLAFLTWIPRMRGPIDLRWDGGVYYVLGTSLAEGHGYRLLNEPGEIHAIQYPPGLPALVAAHELTLGTKNPATVGIALRRTWIVLSLVYATMSFLFARIFLPPILALLTSAACVLSYQMIFLSTLCFAELPFAVTSLVFAYFQLREKQNAVSRTLAPLAGVVTYLLRSIGIALLIAWVTDALLRRQYRQLALRIVVVLVPIVSWQGYVHHIEQSREYRVPAYAYQRDPSMFYNVSYATNVSLKSPFEPEKGRATLADLGTRILENTLLMPSALGEAITTRDWFWRVYLDKITHIFVPSFRIVQVVLFALGLIVTISLVWQLTKRRWILALYPLLTIAAICTTPWPAQFARYLTPIQAFLMICSVSALTHLPVRITWCAIRGNSIAAFSVPVVAIFVSILSCFGAYRNYLDSAQYRDEKGVTHAYKLMHYSLASSSDKALLWLVQHARADAIVAGSMPQWFYLKTGLKTVMAPLEPDVRIAEKLADTVPLNFVVFDHMFSDGIFGDRFARVVTSLPGSWKPVYQTPDKTFQIYQRASTDKVRPKGSHDGVGPFLRF